MDNNPISSNSISFISDKDPSKETEISKKLYEITGYYCDDFSYPVKEMRNFYEVCSDESKFHDHYGVSLVIFDHKDSKKFTEANGKLYKLVEEMNLEKIHFTDLFGKNRI